MTREQKRSQEAVKEDVQRLRDWLNKQPHLPHDVEDEILKTFVCATKTLEDAKRKLDNYYSARVRAPEMYAIDARVAAVSDCRSSKYGLEQFFLPKPTPAGYRVMALLPMVDFEKKFIHYPEFVRFFMLLDMGIRLWPDAAGYIFLVDTKGFSPGVATKISLPLQAVAIHVLQDSFPIKIKGMFFINAPSFLEFVVNTLLRPFVKEKLLKRVKVFSDDMSAIKDLIPLEMMPSNYGGNQKTSSELNDYWLDQLEQNMDWFKQGCAQSSDEKKRPADTGYTYGIDGTFRKLAVD